MTPKFYCTQEFDFECFGPGHRPFAVTNVIDLNGTEVQPGVYNQTIVR